MSSILQIIPAEGWNAVFADPDADPEGDLKTLYYLRPLVCWSLVRYPAEEDFSDFEAVEGQIGMDEVHSASAFPNFLCYLGPGEKVEEDWRDELVALAKREREQQAATARQVAAARS